MSEAHAFPASPSPAPWAEVVPDVGPMTVADLGTLPDDDGWCYELVEGVLVRMPPSRYGASTIGQRLANRLGGFVEEQGLGSVTGEQGGHTLDPRRPRETQVAPDVGFVRAERDIPLTSPDSARAFPGAPDLAVEVAAPTQSRAALATKSRRYLAAGTRLVWVVWPQRRQVEVWRPGAAAPATLAGADLLDGEEVVPGFTMRVAALFA